MVMVDVDGSCHLLLAVQVGWLGLRVCGHLGAESQWLCHDDSTINIILVIIIIRETIMAHFNHEY